MKTAKLFILMAALICATTAWAQTSVSTDSELRAAIQTDGANITVTADINLSNSTLSIESGMTVTINLGGHTLDRKLTMRGEGGGQVITVRSGATLNLSNGTLKGGWGGNAGGIANEAGTANLTNVTITGCTGDDKGGAICNLSGGTLTMTGGSITGNTSFDKDDPTGGGGMFNAEGATATLTGVTITGNQAKSKGGGGICNYGTLTLDGCTITGNTCGKNGGGIYNYSTATLNMQGQNTITDNKGKEGLTHNVFLKENAVITVTGSLAGSSIGVTMEDNIGTFTSGYKKNNSGVDPATVFTADLSEVMAISADANNEAQLANSLPDGDIYYIERSWDDANNVVKAEIKILKSGDYAVMDGGSHVVIGAGDYVVKDDVKYNTITCTEGEKHHLILCDGAKVTTNFLCVEEENELVIYGQSNDTGQLVVNSEEKGDHAGIGSDDSKRVGTIIIHGGHINAHATGKGAGIGGASNCNGGTITIYGGNVHAIGNGDSAGAGAAIGGGDGGNGGTITIYGGDIRAEGGYNGSGIGSGNNYAEGYGVSGPVAPPFVSDFTSSESGSPFLALYDETRYIDGGTITIYGGTIEASSQENGSGIGGGYNSGVGNVTINGGFVKAWSGDNGSGIGTGQLDGAGKMHTGKVTINDGEVYAYGGNDGAGIGGGYSANGVDVTINGGYVYAKGDGNGAGIGSGCEGFYIEGRVSGSLTVTGGHVEAYGGVDAAGIGGGEDADCGTITISGGYVYAEGNDYGPGIGGGQGGDGGNVTITGGIVIAKKGEHATGAIGSGDSDDNGTLTLGDDRCVYITSNLWRSKKENRVSDCFGAAYLQISECLHGGATASVVNGDKHSIADCKWCYVTGEEAHTFGDYGECDVCHLISLANDADNSGVIAHWDGATDKTVTLSGRTLKKGDQWNTLCLPFSLASLAGSPLEGATVKTLNTTAFADGTLTMNFKDATGIEAGKPYLVKWTSGDDIISPVFENIAISNATSNVKTDYADFIGSYDPVDIAGEDKSILYFGANNKLYYPNAAMTIKAFRGYFKLKGIEAGKVSFGDDNPTGIIEVESGKRKVESSADAWYDLSGRRLQGKPTQKGVYINNGNVIMIK